MEIQHGKGPWAPPVSGIVPLGSTLTLVVAINDYRGTNHSQLPSKLSQTFSGEFDMRVKSCVASDGGGHVIQLSDEFGCVLRPKMISRFLKARGADERASVITYAFFHAFKFPDALSVHIKCKVEICRHGCLDHCQIQPDKGDVDSEAYLGPLDRKDDNKPDVLYEDILGEGGSSVKMSLNAQVNNGDSKTMSAKQDGLLDDDKELDITAVPHKV